jgi:hypothetical protein
LSLQHKYDITILEPTTEWKFEAKELAIKNVQETDNFDD